jgi:hypothetical protein
MVAQKGSAFFVFFLLRGITGPLWAGDIPHPRTYSGSKAHHIKRIKENKANNKLNYIIMRIVYAYI